MGIEEQQEEREVLDSIFPDEITDISDTTYRISVTLEFASQDDDDKSEPPTILLTVSLPESYPDTAPNLDLSNPPNAPKHPLLDISEDKTQLLRSLDSTIEENLGMAMIFTLVTTLKEAAEQLMIERQGAVQSEKNREAEKAEEEENRKFHGTAVTKESFLQWRENFRLEMVVKERNEREERELEDRKKRSGRQDEKKITGKQLWESGLAGKVDDEGEGVGEEDEEESEAVDPDGVERLKIKP